MRCSPWAANHQSSSILTASSCSMKRPFHRPQSSQASLTQKRTTLFRWFLYLPMSNNRIVQALCLLGSFQQNTQRAMESWTTNYLMVKAAYQIGIHAPLTYENYSAQDKKERAALWLAVVNHDRLFSCAIGRTSLIPPQHVQDEIFEFASAEISSSRAVSGSSQHSTTFFSHVA